MFEGIPGMPMPYREAEYYEAFKRVRNRLRRFDPGRIVLKAIERLHIQRPGNLDALKRQPPWFLFLLIKWTLVHGSVLPGQWRDLTDREFNVLVNLVHDVDRKARLPSQYPDVFMFFRRLAYQQFWHQEDPSRASVGRQALLFGGLDVSHRFRQWFRSETNVELAEWIGVSFMLLAGLLDEKKHFVTTDFFRPVRQQHPQHVTDAVLRSLSKTPGEIRSFLMALEEERSRESNELRERTPLIRFPLIEFSGRHYYYSIPVLLRSLEDFIYDTLRRHNPEAFMVAFGPMFERYVKRGLEYIGRPFLGEEGVQSLARSGKVVDFLLQEGGMNVFLDAKGVEMHHGGMTSHRPEVITGEAKSSVMKGIAQATEVARALARQDHKAWSRDRNFLLIVTFKDLYLGTGADFYRYVVRERIEKVIGGEAAASAIPLEHMYFASIEEFDYMVQAVKAHGGSIGELLRTAARDDADPARKCFKLSQHLTRRYGDLEAPDYVQAEFLAMIQRATQALGPQGAVAAAPGAASV